jgi:leucyl-tRNA synthetase
MHLIYFRFYTKFLRDIGLLDFDEPVERLFHQGILQGEDGNKMSKSAGNGVDPIDTIKKYGADSLRMFLVSVASPDSDFNWNEKGIESTYKFLNKIYSFSKKVKFGKSSLLFESKINKTIKEITEDIGNMKYNLAVIKLRKLFDLVFEEKELSKKDFEKSLKLLNVFCPYITEEIWHNLGNKNFISLEKWPVADDSKINEKLEKQEEFIKKVGEDINHIKGIIKINNPIAYIYSVPSDLQIINENKQVISKLSGVEVIVYAVNDKNKYDPENKSKNVKPGRPGIFLKEQ